MTRFAVARAGRSAASAETLAIIDDGLMAETLIDAWREAAVDLGIRVDQRGYAVLVPDFRGPGGMLCALPTEGLSTAWHPQAG